MADLKVPSRKLSDKFRLSDYQDDFTALNDEISELKTNGEFNKISIADGALESIKVNENDIELYANTKIFSLGVMNQEDTYTLGMCIEETGKDNFSLRPYGNQVMDLGVKDSPKQKISNIYTKGEIQSNKFIIMNDNTPVLEIKEPYSGDSEIKSHNRFVSLLAEDTSIGSGAGICLEQTSTSRGVVRPYGGHSIDLGTYNTRFYDIYLSNSSRNSNGYTKLPNGLILQWGRSTIQDDKWGVQAHYPINFPNACLNIMAVPHSDGSSPNISVTDFTNTWAKIRGSGGYNCMWMAIGY